MTTNAPDNCKCALYRLYESDPEFIPICSYYQMSIDGECDECLHDEECHTTPHEVANEQ